VTMAPFTLCPNELPCTDVLAFAAGDAARGPRDPGRMAPWSLRSETASRSFAAGTPADDFGPGKEGVN